MSPAGASNKKPHPARVAQISARACPHGVPDHATKTLDPSQTTRAMPRAAGGPCKQKAAKAPRGKVPEIWPHRTNLPFWGCPIPPRGVPYYPAYGPKKGARELKQAPGSLERGPRKTRRDQPTRAGSCHLSLPCEIWQTKPVSGFFFAHRVRVVSGLPWPLFLEPRLLSMLCWLRCLDLRGGPPHQTEKTQRNDPRVPHAAFFTAVATALLLFSEGAEVLSPTSLIRHGRCLSMVPRCSGWNCRGERSARYIGNQKTH